MFSITPTCAEINSVKLILKLLRHVLLLIHRFQGVYKLCQLELGMIKIIKYNTAVCRYGKI
jgi:hypothetical protein